MDQQDIEGPIVPRDADDDSAVDFDANSSRYSLRESILEYRQENGRTYHRLSDGKYILPNDALEQERLELVNHLYIVTFEGRLCMCPKNQTAKRVLDLGTGTGCWALDYADEHPEAEVVGVDLSPIQPTMVAPNCRFLVDDLEKEWIWTRKFDFIFSRCLMGCFSNWENILANAFEHLEPGGYFEFQDTFLPIKCDDGTLAPDSPLLRWTELLVEGTRLVGRPVTLAPEMGSMLERAGFEDVVVTKRRWAHAPWPRDRRLRELGVWSQAASLYDIEALTLALFTRVLGWSQEDTIAFCELVRRDLKNREIHAYWDVYSVYGRKPLGTASEASSAVGGAA